MTTGIIYIQDNGVISVLTPSQEALKLYGLRAIAEKDVPPGKPFKFVTEEFFPKDWPQETWEIDESELTDGVGNSSNTFE